MLIVVVQRHRDGGRDSRRRRRGRDDHRWRSGWLDMISVFVRMGDARAVVIGFCRRRAVVTVTHAGDHACRRRKRDDDPEADQHRRVDERGNWITVLTAVPDPTGAHNDIELEQQRTKVSGLDKLGFSCVWTEGRASRTGKCPQCESADIKRYPRS